ncbi:MAG: four helix bundle protein [Ferruginibacter sp.]
MKTEQPKNLIAELSFEFALKIIKYAESLNENKKYIISNQLLKSGTSIGANVKEAQNAESRADFIHKIKIAAKEAGETEYWLQLCKVSENNPVTDELLSSNLSIIRILSRIIISAKTEK